MADAIKFIKTLSDFEITRSLSMPMAPGTLYSIGLSLVFVGIVVIVVVALLMFVFGSKGKGEITGGGAIIVGPVPIIFGTDKKSLKTILLFSITLTVLLIILIAILNLMFK